MKRVCINLFFILFYGIVSGYENNLPNLVTPSELTPGQLEFDITHRLYDRLADIPVSGLFNAGAGIKIGLRGCVWDHFIPYFYYNSHNSEIQLGVNYSLFDTAFFLRGLADISFFSLKKADRTTEQNIFILIALQTVRLGDFLCVGLDLGYDNFNQAFGAAIGLDGKVAESFHVYAEYAQNIAGAANNPDILKNGFLSFGIKFETWGHHFMFTIQNSAAIGIRNLLLGTPSYENWYFGFTIQRKIDLT